MKKVLQYEIAAGLLALVGAAILVGVYFPLLNPGMYKVETGHRSESIGYYIILTPIPLLILIAAWHFNTKTRAIRKQLQMATPARETNWERKLKWILGLIVLALVLIAFFW